MVHGIAHITGGGLTENLPRVIDERQAVRIRKNAWPRPSIFDLVREVGDIDEEEMYEVFNMGVGMALIVSEYYARAVMRRLKRAGVESWLIGEVVRGKGNVVYK